MKNRSLYLNWNGEDGKEPIEEITQEKGQSRRDFMAYARQLQDNYDQIGINPYISSRCCKDWNEGAKK